jgi:hypothetical protein
MMDEFLKLNSLRDDYYCFILFETDINSMYFGMNKIYFIENPFFSWWLNMRLGLFAINSEKFASIFRN